MRLSRFLPMVALLFLTGLEHRPERRARRKRSKRSRSMPHNGLTIKVRMEGLTMPTHPCKSSATSSTRSRATRRSARCGRTGQEARRRHRLASQPG